MSTVQTADDVRVSTLPGGVRVVTEAMPDVRSVSVGFWVDCGSRDETVDRLGATHFLEHLLFKGTGRRSAADIAEEVDAVGGELNAFTSKEFTCFTMRCLDRDLDLAVDVLGDMITAATLNPEDVDAERDVVLEEIRLLSDTPDELVESVFSEAYYASHPLGREVLGSSESIAEMPRDVISHHYETAYVPQRLVVAVAGNCDHDRVVARVQDAMGDWEAAGEPGPARRPPAGAGGPRVTVRQRPTEQVHLLLGGPGLSRSDERRFAAGVLDQALGGGMSSRLFQEIRERHGLVYTVCSGQASHTDTGTYDVYAGTARHKVPEVLDLTRAQFADVCGGGLTDEEVERAKSHLTGSLVLALEDTGSRMMRLGKALVTGTPLLTVDEAVSAVEAVSREDVERVAKTLLSGPFTLALVGPLEAEDRAEDAFRRHVQPLEE